jgi:hypothetical protein
MPSRYVMIANPGTKRCETYRTEFGAYWQARGAAVELEVVPWAEVISRDGNLDELKAFDSPAIVRMESPGKDDNATRLLLEAGARENPSEPARNWRELDLPKGLLVRPGLLYRGFRRVLRGLRKSFDVRPHLKPTACPLAIAEMFDKRATCRKLEKASVPLPEMLTDATLLVRPIGGSAPRVPIRCPSAWPTTYVKLNTGSSATGIVVLYTDERAIRGTTTLAEIEGQFYNSRLVRNLSGTELERAVRFVISEGAIVQRGIPMAQIDGQNFDVRVVCVYGQPVATIFRLSHHPMTNLHLGGRRGDYDRCRAAIPTRNWLDALDHCADAAGCFDSAIAGVDLLFERGFRRHYILEVNAFGDFFPGWTDAKGRSIHAMEIDETVRRSS